MRWIFTQHLHDALAAPERAPWCILERVMYVLEHPLHRETQPDGRTRVWGYIKEIDKYLRVVVDADGKTVITAHPDRNFKQRMARNEN